MGKVNLDKKWHEMQKDDEIEITFKAGYIVKPSWDYSDVNDRLVEVDCFNDVKMKGGSLEYKNVIQIEFTYLPNEGEPIRSDANLHNNVFNAVKTHKIRARHRKRNLGVPNGEADYFEPIEKRQYLFLEKEQALIVVFVRANISDATHNIITVSGISSENLGPTDYYPKKFRDNAIEAIADFIMKKTQHLFAGREHNLRRAEYPLIIQFIDRMLPK